MMFSMSQKYKRFILPSLLLLVVKIVISIHYFNLLDQNIQSLGGITLRDSPQAWIKAFGGADAGAYLNAAYQFSQSGKLDSFCSECKPQITPFYFWAPGVPFSQGLILKLFGNDNMNPIFFFVVAVDILTALGSLWILCLMTSNALAILIGIFFVSLNFPLALLYYGSNALGAGPPAIPVLTTSEPLALLFFIYSLLLIYIGLDIFWKDHDRFPVRSLLLFGISGLLIGFSSLVRDSSAQFSYFFAVALVGLVFIRQIRKWKYALAGGLLLVLCTNAVRFPVKKWNRDRIGAEVISSSGSVGIWRYGVWGDYSKADPANIPWIEDSGLGFGSYLEPQKGIEIREHFERGDSGANRLAGKEFVLAVLRHPIDAFWFKLRRLPVLFLNASIISNAEMRPLTYYCLILYLFLLIHLLRNWWWREWPLEIFYLYPTFLLLASPLIHFEFRYSFPAIIVLQILPGYEIFKLIEWNRRRRIREEQSLQ